MTIPALISVDDLTNAQVEHLLGDAFAIKAAPHAHHGRAVGRVLALMFFEPSTRTYFSFSSAMQKLGGGVIGFNGAAGTSLEKGESLVDTARMLTGYADALVVRHSEHGVCHALHAAIGKPVINAGEGADEHPTQALLDLMTIRESFGARPVHVALYGDLKYSRPNHSLIKLLARFGARFTCVAPDAVQMPSEYSDAAKAHGARIDYAGHLTPDMLGGIDVLYVSRLQKERLPDALDYAAMQEQFRLTEAMVNHMPAHALVMHPLPRLSEIAVEIDTNPRAAYFRQAQNGLFMRMAILSHLLGLAE